MGYSGPDFVNDGPPAINAANLNGMVDELELLDANAMMNRNNYAITSGSINDSTYLYTGMWYFSNTVSDLPVANTFGSLITFHNLRPTSNGATVQIFVPTAGRDFYVRYIVASKWSSVSTVPWSRILGIDDLQKIMNNKTKTASDFAYSDLNDVLQTGLYYISNMSVLNLPELTVGALMVLNCIDSEASSSGSKCQIYITANNTIYTRFIRATSITAWQSLRKADNSPYLNIIYVDQSGAGDFTTVKAALDSITNSNSNNRYEVRIRSGIYDILEELGGDAFLESITDKSNMRRGLDVPNYTKIVGIGKVILNLLPADNKSDTNTTASISMFEVRGECELENLDIKVKNCRYAIHDEGSNAAAYRNMKHKYRNLKIQHLGNITGGWVSSAAIAHGSSSGCEYIYENCIMSSATYYPWSMHNYGNQSTQYIIFDGCSFDGAYAGNSLKFGYYQKNSQDNYIFLKNMLATGGVKVMQESAQVESDNPWVFKNFTDLVIS